MYALNTIAQTVMATITTLIDFSNKLVKKIVSKKLTFGIEIETFVSRGDAKAIMLRAVQSVVGGEIVTRRNSHGWMSKGIEASDGRVWLVVSDASIKDNSGHQAGIRGAEVVSPILQYSDIPVLQEIVRAMRRAGGKTNSSCGIHIHVGVKNADGETVLDCKAMSSLQNQVYKYDKYLDKALQIHSVRRHGRYGNNQGYVRYVGQAFVRGLDRLAKKRGQDNTQKMGELNELLYGYRNSSPDVYASERYYTLNFHSFFYGGNTVEMRAFNSVLHAGKVKSFVQLYLAMVVSATEKSTKFTPQWEVDGNEDVAAFKWRVFMKSIGLVGDEFKTLRGHFLKNFGNSSRGQEVLRQRRRQEEG